MNTLNFTLDETVVPGLKPITIPFFLSGDAASSATIFSYVSIGLSLIFVGLILLWVLYVVRSAFQIISSQGDSKKVEGAYGKLRIIIGAIVFLFVFYIALALVGGFIGLGGNIFEWPKALSICKDGTYYFQTYLKVNAQNQSLLGAAGVENNADVLCFNPK